MKPSVIILGGHVQAYGIIRILADYSGIKPIVIDNKKFNIAKHSKHCQRFYHVSYRHTLKLLLAFKEKGLYKNWVVYPTDDYYVKILSENKAQLSEHFHVAVDSWDKVKVFFDKRLSYPLADSLGVPVPRTLYPDSLESIKSLANSIDYPCIIKPAIMRDFYSEFKTKAIKCNTPNELTENLEKVSKVMPIDSVMVQELIPGYFELQYSVAMLFDGTKTINHLVAKRKRQHPILFGNATTYAETADIPELLEYAERILKSVSYQGICEVEFKYDVTSHQYKFLEVNPRLWKWHYLTKAAKVPLLESSYDYHTKGHYQPSANYKDAAWIDIVTDIKARIDYLRKGKLTHDKEKNLVYAVFNKADLMPFIWQLIYLPCFMFSVERNCGM